VKSFSEFLYTTHVHQGGLYRSGSALTHLGRGLQRSPPAGKGRERREKEGNERRGRGAKGEGEKATGLSRPSY